MNEKVKRYDGDFIAPLPPGFESLDEFEVKGKYRILAEFPDHQKGSEDGIKDQGDSAIVGDI